MRKKEDVESLCIACRVFGAPGWRAPIRFSDFSALPPHPTKLPRQQFVAIDRFTGGASRGKLFDAERPDSVTLAGGVEIESNRMCFSGYGLLALVLRDLSEGDIQFGLGRAKGYGSCTVRRIGFKRLAKGLTAAFSSSVDPERPLFNQFRGVAEQSVVALRDEVRYVARTRSGGSAANALVEGTKTPAQEPTAPSGTFPDNRFLNPYHFIPLAAPDVAGWRTVRRPDANSELSHAHYAAGTHSGRIVCRLTARTPLVVGGYSKRDDRNDAAVADPVPSGGEQKSRAGQPAPVKPFELDGKPAIPASSLRGMFSSLFEAATGSALRVLGNELMAFHKTISGVKVDGKKIGGALKKLGMLVLEQDRVFTLVPLSESGCWIYVGGSFIEDKSSFTLADPEFYFVQSEWLEEKWKGAHKVGYRLAQNCVPIHGQDWSDPGSSRGDFVACVLYALGKKRQGMAGTKKHELLLGIDWDTFEALRDGRPERIKSRLTVLPCAIGRFDDLSLELFEAQKDERLTDEDRLPFHPVGTRSNRNDPLKLQHGDIVYYDEEGGQVTEVSFSAVWRGRVETGDARNKQAARPHDFFKSVSPECVPFGPGRTTLSMAEAVFGFVSEATEQSPLPAYASRIRFGFGRIASEPKFMADDGRTGYYEPAVVLKQMVSPKLPSPAMYFKHKDGSGGYIPKVKLDPAHHRPQGRKFYLHDTRAATENVYESEKPRRIAELEKKTSKADNERKELNDRKKEIQNHLEVIPLPPETVFHFHVDFDNLTDDELAALCFALEPSAGFHHKLGLGKPLGLGSVKVEPLGAFLVERARRYGEQSVFSDERYHRAWYAKPDDAWPKRYPRERPEGLAEAKRDFDLHVMRDGFAQKLARSDPDVARAIALLGAFETGGIPVHYPPRSGLHGNPR